MNKMTFEEIYRLRLDCTSVDTMLTRDSLSEIYKKEKGIPFLPMVHKVTLYEWALSRPDLFDLIDNKTIARRRTK